MRGITAVSTELQSHELASTPSCKQFTLTANAQWHVTIETASRSLLSD